MTQLVKWEPFREATLMRERLNKMLGNLEPWLEPLDTSLASEWAPAVDVFEKDGEIDLRAELPGMTEKEVEITVENGHLVLRGEKKRRHEEGKENGHYCRVETFYGSFYRSFPLPREVDASKIRASMKDGVLDITMPKIEGVKPKQIKVKAA